MQSRKYLLFCGLLAGCATTSLGQQGPPLTGYVTRAVSASDFDVNGLRILCREKSQVVSKSARSMTEATAACPGVSPYVAEPMAVDYIVRNASTNAVYATRIQVQRPQPFGGISGSAVVVAATAQDGAGTASLMVRADGYRIRITGKTKMEWVSPVNSLADIKSGNWIEYKGRLDSTGVLAAASVRIGPDTISAREGSLRKKDEYDSSAVPTGAKQSFLKDGIAGGCGGSMLIGCDPKKFPPFADSAMQSRIEKIGNNLIPHYQRDLPSSDPAKIDFRFQLIDTKLFRDVLALSSGIILVPHQVVERLQNNSQLSAVLAEGIASVLEKQEYRTERKAKIAFASGMASAFVPYGGFGVGVGSSYAREIEEKAMEQRDRVSVALMREAGYDIEQAPMAWWLLTPGKQQAIFETVIPDRVAYLYRILETVWRNPAASVPGIH